MGGLGGLASAMAYVWVRWGLLSSEESAGASAMRGLIPVSRTAQVVGRYLLLLVAAPALGSGRGSICGGRSSFSLAIWPGISGGFGALAVRCLHLRFGYHSSVGAAGLCVPVHLPQDDGRLLARSWLACMPSYRAAGPIACRLAMAVAECCRFPDDLVAYGACSRRAVSARIFWLHAF